MKKILLAIYFLVIVALAMGTGVEYTCGTTFSLQSIYHSYWFIGLWGCLAAGLLYALGSHHLPLLSAKGVLHLSFIVILLGALITHYFGIQGIVHLTPQSKVTSFTDVNTQHPHALPFTMQLDSFHIDYYPGGVAPKDYQSHLKVDGDACIVSMNQVLSVRGYRFYQSSYDENGEGSWLRVNHDPWGMGITYMGYTLLAIGSISLLCSPRSGFRRLLQKTKQLSVNPTIILFTILLISGSMIKASASPLKVLHARQADSLALQPIIYQDRVAPLNTLAIDFVKKLTGKSHYKGLTPEQVLGGWLLAPGQWETEPMIRIKSETLRHRMNLPHEYVSFRQLFEADGSYKLRPLWKALQHASPAIHRPNEPLEKAILEVDEKVGIILLLREGKLIQPLPRDGSIASPSILKMKAEVFYNHLPFNKILFMFNLSIGLLALIVWIKKEAQGHSHHSSWMWQVALVLSLSTQLLSYALRGYISGHLPLSNGYETMQFLALATLFTASLLQRRFTVLLPFGFLLSGFTLLVAHLGQMNPHITPLMPVLLSPWLSIHVSLIMMAYALFGFTFLIAILTLTVQHQLPESAIERLTTLSRILLYPALLFLGIGIFIGAIWANESWGRYWAWDPKEVWALISFMTYGVAVHSISIPWLHRPTAYHGYLIMAFFTILMTYFGVNYLLGGMHSYAG